MPLCFCAIQGSLECNPQGHAPINSGPGKSWFYFLWASAMSLDSNHIYFSSPYSSVTQRTRWEPRLDQKYIVDARNIISYCLRAVISVLKNKWESFRVRPKEDTTTYLPSPQPEALNTTLSYTSGFQICEIQFKNSSRL